MLWQRMERSWFISPNTHWRASSRPRSGRRPWGKLTERSSKRRRGKEAQENPTGCQCLWDMRIFLLIWQHLNVQHYCAVHEAKTHTPQKQSYLNALKPASWWHPWSASFALPLFLIPPVFSLLRVSAAAYATPTTATLRQRLFHSLVEPVEATSAPLDITHTPTPPELLAHKVLQSLEEEKAESKRYTYITACDGHGLGWWGSHR